METLRVHLSAMFLVVVMLTGSLSCRTAQRESGATILIDSDDTSGVVRGPKGPEAGSPRTNAAQ